MTTPLKWKSKIVLFKVETSYGVDPTPAAGNGILMTDVEFRPLEGQDVSRNLELSYLGGQELIPVGLHCVLSGNVELVPSGTLGTAPKWGPLMRACGCAETIVASTSVAYSPISDNHESGYLYFWVGGTRHKVKGIRGDVTMMLNAQGLPQLRYVLTGLYGGVADAARTSPTLSGFKRPRVVTKANTPTFTINSVALAMRSFSLAMKNQVAPRLLVGLEEVLITDRDDQITTQVQATPIATFDPYTLSQADEAASLIPVALVHGTASGYIATLAAPTCQLQRPSGFANQDNITEWPLSLKVLGSAGDDQWSLTLT